MGKTILFLFFLVILFGCDNPRKEYDDFDVNFAADSIGSVYVGGNKKKLLTLYFGYIKYGKYLIKTGNCRKWRFNSNGAIPTCDPDDINEWAYIAATNELRRLKKNEK